MQICYVRKRHNKKSGWRPDLPKNCGFLLLADVRGLHWGIYQISSNQDFSSHPHIRPVPRTLRTLVLSAKMYPPALALARDCLSRKFATRRPTRPQFQRAYATCLRKYLQSQDKFRFPLVEAVADEVPYLSSGGFYWAVRYDRATRSLFWVSDDYFVYRNNVEHFKINRAALKSLA